MVDDVLAASFLLLIVFLIFFAIKRWYGIEIFQESSKMQKTNAKPPILDVVNVNNPFSIEVECQQSEDDYFATKISAKRTCSIQSFWNVNLAKAIELFHSSSAKNQVSSNVQLTDFLVKCSTLQDQGKIIHPTNEDPYLYLVDTSNIERILEDGAALPVKICTLIVSAGLPKDACSEAVLNEDIVCLFTIFNVEINRGDKKRTWKIGYQIIQTADGRLFTLKNLYASGVPDLDSGPETSSLASSSQPDLCVICHSNYVTRALLPCRHQCICGACFKRTKLCPVCRRSVTSYLVTSDESHLVMPMPDEEELAEQTRDGLSSMGLVELIKAIWNAS